MPKSGTTGKDRRNTLASAKKQMTQLKKELKALGVLNKCNIQEPDISFTVGNIHMPGGISLQVNGSYIFLSTPGGSTKSTNIKDILPMLKEEVTKAKKGGAMKASANSERRGTNVLDKKYANMIASEIENSVQDQTEDEPNSANDLEKDPNKLQYIISRGVEEVSRLIDDLNVEMDDILDEKSKKVGTLALNEDGSGAIELQKVVNLTEPDKAETVIAKQRNMPVRDKFDKYVKWSIVPPTALSPSIIIKCRITLPASFMTELVGGNPNELFKKAISSMDSFAKDLLKRF